MTYEYRIDVTYLISGKIMVEISGGSWPRRFKKIGYDLDRLLTAASNAIIDHRNDEAWVATGS